MNNKNANSKQCHTIFFDLEFYVPESNRKTHGFCYNPWSSECKFLGGAFYVKPPSINFDDPNYSIETKIQSHWLWKFKSEKKLLLTIYKLLNEVMNSPIYKNGQLVSPILCGIGITSSDVPILFELFKKYRILSNSKAFAFQNRFRIIDLSQLAIPTINSSGDIFYPVTKNQILKKYFKDKKIANGRTVWNLFEWKKYKKIESRVIDEIVFTYSTYCQLKNDYAKL